MTGQDRLNRSAFPDGRQNIFQGRCRQKLPRTGRISADLCNRIPNLSQKVYIVAKIFLIRWIENGAQIQYGRVRNGLNGFLDIDQELAVFELNLNTKFLRAGLD